MSFVLPDDAADLSQALRDAEAQAPKPLKALLIQAATELDAHKRLHEECAEELQLALSLRVGHMDSESRVVEVTNEIRATLERVIGRLHS